MSATVTPAPPDAANAASAPRVASGSARSLSKKLSFMGRRGSRGGDAGPQAAVKLQAAHRGYVVRRLQKTVTRADEVRRGVGRLDSNRAGFLSLLLYISFCVLTCVLVSFQYYVPHAYEVDAALRARVEHIETDDGSTYDTLGLDPDQVLDWIEAAVVELHDDNHEVIVDINKYGENTTDDGDGDHRRALRGSGRRRLSEAGGDVCDSHEIPACCRWEAFKKGVEADDYDEVYASHKFGHNRIATPLFVKLVRRQAVHCEHGTGEDDPLRHDVFPNCYSETLENHTHMFRASESHPPIWKEYLSEHHAYVMPIDLGLWRLPSDDGVCHLEEARRWGWIDTSAKRLEIEYGSYNGHRELWTLLRVTLEWELGGQSEVSLHTLTVPLRNEYAHPRDWVRAALEALYVGLLCYYVHETTVRWRQKGLLNAGWLLLDVASHLAVIANIMLWVVLAVEGARFQVWAYTEHELTLDTNEHTTWTEWLELLEHLEFAEADFVAITVVQSVMLLLLTVRLFRFLAFHEQFSLVTSTLIKAYAALAHFFVVFVIVWLLFAFVGHNLLGHELEVFATYPAAINQMFSMIVFDDTVSFTDIQRVAPVAGHVFYWLWFVLSSLMLINVLLAILLDSYALVSERAKMSNYIWTDISVQLRLGRYWAVVDRQVYAKARVAEEGFYKLSKKSRHVSLARAKQLLEGYGLPPFVVWNIVLVLERVALADAEQSAVEAKLDELQEQLSALTSQLRGRATGAGPGGGEPEADEPRRLVGAAAQPPVASRRPGAPAAPAPAINAPSADDVVTAGI